MAMWISPKFGGFFFEKSKNSKISKNSKNK